MSFQALLAHKLHRVRRPYCDISQVSVFQHRLLFVVGARFFFGFLSVCLWYVALADTADFQDNKHPTILNLQGRSIFPIGETDVIYDTVMEK